jgi:hypothetical protein
MGRTKDLTIFRWDGGSPCPASRATNGGAPRLGGAGATRGLRSLTSIDNNRSKMARRESRPNAASGCMWLMLRRANLNKSPLYPLLH